MAMILLVDPDSVNRQQIRIALRSYQPPASAKTSTSETNGIVTAENATEALDTLSKEPFDVMLVRYEQGTGMASGLAFLKQLPEDRKNIPVIVLFDFEHAMELKADSDYKAVRPQIRREIAMMPHQGFVHSNLVAAVAKCLETPRSHLFPVS